MKEQSRVSNERRTTSYLAVLSALLMVVVFVAACRSAQSQSSQLPQEVVIAIKNKDFRRAIELLEPAVKRGDAQARTLTGFLCVPELAGACQSHEAVSLLTPSAEKGNADAQYALAVALLSARPAQTEKALTWLEKAARAEHVLALFVLGQAEAASANPSVIKQGTLRVKRAAELGYAPAQFGLAVFHDGGTALNKSPEEAARWYRAAADQGHTVAQTRLGSLYERGLGVKTDIKLADRWYRAAAEAAYTEAQYSLGMMYMLGNVVQADYYEGTYWLEKAAEAGYAKAQDALGRAYFDGVGVRQDREKALLWFRRAGEQGHLAAQNNAGLIYEHDFYLQNYTLAAQWYQRAAAAGYEHAMINLGDLYRLGYGVPKSLSMAQSWYSMATKSKDPEMADRARKRMHAALSDSLDISMAAFGLGRRFPTPGELFDAIIGAGIVEIVLYPKAGRRADPDLQATIDEVDRINRAGQQKWQQRAIEGFLMKP
jgi:TPR repeat protein